MGGILRGQKLGRYELLARLAVGGMAELYLASITGPGGFRKFVAVKRILPYLQNEEDFRAMFLDEARISAALSHANIAQVFDLGEDKDELYLTMEFIAGQDVSTIARSAMRANLTLPLAVSCTIARDVALALHHAHHFTSPSGRELPIIHRDISPRNLMVTYSGSTKVIDFGIAKARGSLNTTAAGRVKGTCAFMSPEQIRGEALDGRSDLFSLGVVLYELLTRTRAFRMDDDTATMYRILNVEVAPPSSLNPLVPAALSAVVMKALSKNRDERFQNGRELAAAIEKAAPQLGEESVSAWMAEHFAEGIAQTRRLFALADEGDEVRVSEAAAALKQHDSRPDHDPESAERRAASSPTEAGPRESTAATKPARVPPMATPPHPTAAQEPLGQLSQPGEDTVTFARQAAPLPVQPPHAPPRKPTVLVVDDSATGRRILELLLTANGLEVLSAESAKQALEMLRHVRPDLLALDVRMPEMDGFELCQKIRENAELRLTPILFVSAACSLEERVKGLSVGGDDFIRKPFEAPEFVARVRLHLQKASMMKAATPR